MAGFVVSVGLVAGDGHSGMVLAVACIESVSRDLALRIDVVAVLNGHDHDYERFAPQDPSGRLDSQRGIREFVIGTGGKNSHRSFAAPKPNSEVRQADTFGVLKLTLRPDSYDWEFVPQAGKTFTDSGSGKCH